MWISERKLQWMIGSAVKEAVKNIDPPQVPDWKIRSKVSEALEATVIPADDPEGLDQYQAIRGMFRTVAMSVLKEAAATEEMIDQIVGSIKRKQL